MNYALIVDGIVANIIYLHPSNASDFSNAVYTEELPIEVGDTYDGEKFYRNGEVVLPFSTITEAQIAAIKDMAIAEVEGAVLNGTDE